MRGELKIDHELINQLENKVRHHHASDEDVILMDNRWPH